MRRSDKLFSMGKLYRPLHQLGEETQLDLELYGADGELLSSFRTLHEADDGLSLLIKSINESGRQNWAVPLGNLKSKPKSLTERLARIIGALQQRTKHQSTPNPVRANDLGPLASPKVHQQGSVILKPTALEEVQSHCRRLRVSLNSALAAAVFKAEAEVFPLAENESRQWMIPVNIRHSPTQQGPGGLYSSYVLLRTAPDAEVLNPRSVDRQLQEKLKSGEHWGNYDLGLLLSALPGPLLNWLTKYDFKKQTSDVAGSFSNLGGWPSESQTLPPALQNCYWVMFGTVRRDRPLAVLVIQWEDTLTLGLRLHRSIPHGQEKLQQLKELIKKHLTSGGKV